MKHGFIKAAAVVGIFSVLLFFVIGCFPQQGNQMYPALKDGDLAITNRLTREYRYSAVVAYRAPDGSTRLGRIVGVPGDELDITTGGAVSVNGSILSEAVFYPAAREGDRIGQLPCRIPEGHYYVLNDHRTETDDSRSYGPIPESDLRGEVFWMFRRREF